MPYYKRAEEMSLSSNAVFDTILHPGTVANTAGIYRCMGCGWEATCEIGRPLPPQNHHLHDPGKGPIMWRLSAAAKHHKTF